MSELTSMKNIGKAISEKLIAVGITTPEQLRQVGAQKAFFYLKTSFPNVCLVHLYTLQGAVDDIDFRDLSKDMKADLKAYSDSMKTSQ